MTPEAKHDAVNHGLQAMPSLGAIMLWLSGLTIEKWLGLAGIAFILLQAIGYAWRLRRDIKREKERRDRGLPPPDTDRGEL